MMLALTGAQGRLELLLVFICDCSHRHLSAKIELHITLADIRMMLTP